VRLIAASNANISELAAAGKFRQDLKYRLSVISIRMPALRERPEDIIPLANHFIRRYARRYGGAEKTLNHESIELLLRHPWPGNIRELESLIHREFLLAEGAALRIERSAFDAIDMETQDAKESMQAELGFRKAKAAAIEEFERDYLIQALSKSGGNVTIAAQMAGKERRSFGKLIKKHGISSALYRH
jgi:two-component system, NtrC family, response regulator GlrR